MMNLRLSPKGARKQMKSGVEFHLLTRVGRSRRRTITAVSYADAENSEDES